MQTIPAGKFKATCLSLIDEVFETGKSITITKYGNQRAMLVPIPATKGSATSVEAIHRNFRGMIELNCDPDELIGPIIPLSEWNHLKDEQNTGVDE